MNQVTNDFNLAVFAGSRVHIKQNTAGPYKNTNEDKYKIIEILYKKIDRAKLAPDIPLGDKNLLYYSVFGIDYVMLLEQSLTTIHKHTPNKKFDVLFITDEATKILIECLDVLKNFKYDFYIVDSPSDGIEASKLKVKIYKYSKITEYKKVLFLDIDILANKDISVVFDTEIENGIEVVDSPLIERALNINGLILAGSITHGLGFFTEEEKKYVLTENPKVFNAGQYLFNNTRQMIKHFENIDWLMDIWPSVYYFEQSFVNHYFNLQKISSYKFLNRHVTIFKNVPNTRGMNVEDMVKFKQHNSECALLHFAGTPGDGKNKYNFINHYCKEHSICL